MIFSMNKKYLLISCCLMIALMTGLNAFASENDKLEIYMELSTWKYANDSRVLVASMTANDDSGEIPVVGVTVAFISSTDTTDLVLGSIESDSEGKAKLNLDPAIILPVNEEGYINFIALFEGDDHFEMAEAELAIKDAWIDISFFIEDSVKMIQYEGSIIDVDGTEIPLADDDIYLYVPRMFSLMIIEEGWLEEDGHGSMEFPLDLIGDSTGLITVIARIEEHFDYGNLEASAQIDWAIPWHTEKREGPQRELWTPIAPLWMIITLIIMLAGVWGHYIYAVFQLYKIKKAAKNE